MQHNGMIVLFLFVCFGYVFVSLLLCTYSTIEAHLGGVSGTNAPIAQTTDSLAQPIHLAHLVQLLLSINGEPLCSFPLRTFEPTNYISVRPMEYLYFCTIYHTIIHHIFYFSTRLIRTVSIINLSIHIPAHTQAQCEGPTL